MKLLLVVALLAAAAAAGVRGIALPPNGAGGRGASHLRYRPLPALGALLDDAAADDDEPVKVARFDGQRVVQLDVLSEAGARALVYDGAEAGAFDVWRPDGELRVGSVADVRVMDEAALAALVASGDVRERGVLMADVQAAIDAADQVQRPYRASVARPAATADFFRSYHSYEGYAERIKEWVNEAPQLVTVVDSIGKSFEGRDIMAVKVAGPGGATAPADRRKVLVTSMHHSREWVSPATTMYIVERLVKSYGNDANITALLDTLELLYVPVINPDGYLYSNTTNRMWRKNRRVNEGSSAIGVDCNRNWAAKWCTVGASRSPASDIYCGPSEFSESETQAVRDFFLGAGNGLIGAANDFHSYSQLILRPYGFERAPAPGEEAAKALSERMAASIMAVHGVRYRPIPVNQLTLAAGGGSDWFHIPTGGNAPFGMAMELRDTGRHGFILPPDQIIPTGEENFPAWLDTMRAVVALPKYASNKA